MKTLVAADALIHYNGNLIGPLEQETIDMKTAIQSLKKFLDLEIEKVICYHGGVFHGNPHTHIERLLF